MLEGRKEAEDGWLPLEHLKLTPWEAEAARSPIAARRRAERGSAKADAAAGQRDVDERKAKGKLAQGLALERAGKTEAALTYYHEVVREFPGTTAAKAAAARIKASTTPGK